MKLKFYFRTWNCSLKQNHNEGRTCSDKVVNEHSREMFSNMSYYPGLLHYKDGQWKCQNILVTQDTHQTDDYDAFQVLVKS